MNAQNVGEILDALAVRFGSTGAHLWDVLVRQVYVNAAASVLFALVAAGASWFVFRRLTGTEDYTDERIGWVAVSIVVGFVDMAALIALTTCVPLAFNPEYGALQTILNALQ